MKIAELLCTNAYWVTGYKTRIVADNSFGATNIIFMVYGIDKSSRYTIDLYRGESEEEAVSYFIDNEKS
jgi:hypothetical protein